MVSSGKLHYREAGAGEAVLLLHSNAATSVQWRMLMEHLSPHYHVVAVDMLGAGDSPPWPKTGDATYSMELDGLDEVIAKISKPFSLIGHSYGGAVALMAALRHRDDIRAMALYEPTLFAPCMAASPNNPAFDGIWKAASHAIVAMENGKPDLAAEAFLDFWMGKGTWQAMGEKQKSVIAGSMDGIPNWAGLLFKDKTPLDAFAELKMPILYMTGGKSPSAAGAVADLLGEVLPDVTRHDFPSIGHMGPISDPDEINSVIEGFLA